MDGTLIKTEAPETGKDLWLRKTGSAWPHKGWWGKKETLDLEIFDNNLIEFTHNKYLEYKLDPSNLIVLMTGRHVGMKNEVLKLLDYHNLKFDLIRLNDGGDTIVAKKRQITELLEQYPDLTEISIYEDRYEHFNEFIDFFKSKPYFFNITHIK